MPVRDSVALCGVAAPSCQFGDLKSVKDRGVPLFQGRKTNISEIQVPGGNQSRGFQSRGFQIFRDRGTAHAKQNNVWLAG